MSAPFATVARLVRALEPGETGCLRRGRYRTDVRLSRRARAAARIVLRAVPGEHATICGFVLFKRSAAWWRLTRLHVDGSCSSQNTVQIYADHVTLDHLEVTNRHQAQSCIMLGAPREGHPRDASLHHNRIHDCGRSASHYFHGIYANTPRGARITDNLVYANAGFGIHLYPDAQGVVVERNIVDRNYNEAGLVFGGAAGSASSQNVVRRNVFSANGTYGVTASWGRRVGDGNLLTGNCFWRNRTGAYARPELGFRAWANFEAEPRFVGSPPRDYRLRRKSRCRAMQPRGHVGP